MARYCVSSSFLGVVLSVRLAFSKRSWPYLAACAVPWLLCAGQRCVTRLAALGSHRRSRSGYYRWLSDGKWRLEVFFKCLFDLIVATFRISSLVLVLFRHALAKVGAWHLRDGVALRSRSAAAGGIRLGSQLGGACGRGAGRAVGLGGAAFLGGVVSVGDDLPAQYGSVWTWRVPDASRTGRRGLQGRSGLVFGADPASGRRGVLQRVAGRSGAGTGDGRGQPAPLRRAAAGGQAAKAAPEQAWPQTEARPLAAEALDAGAAAVEVQDREGRHLRLWR